MDSAPFLHMDKNTRFKDFQFQIKEVGEDDFTIRAVFSTADEDRHGEIVDQKGWKLDKFLQNPVVLFSHDHNQPPIGKVVELGYNDEGNLEGVIEFAAKEYPFARTIFNLYKGGFMRAFSAGFINTRIEFDSENEKVYLRENELFEVSTVAVPANAMALAKSKGIDITPLEDFYTKGIEKNVEVEEVVEEEAIEEVLSDDVRERVEKARAALDELLAVSKSANKDTQVDSSLESNPEVSGGVKKVNKNRIINKAVRALLEAKA